MRIWTVALLSVLAGCGWHVEEAKVVDPPDGAAEATAAVVQALEVSTLTSVYWYAPDDCSPGITDPMGGCDLGFRIDDVVVLSTQGGVTIHETALAHEFGHLASLEHDGTSDNAGGSVAGPTSAAGWTASRVATIGPT